MRSPFIVLLVCLFSTSAAAQTTTPTPAQPAQPSAKPEPEYPIVRVGMVSYVQYDVELENRDSFNAFDLTRGYININGQLSRWFRFRFTPDIRRATDGSLSGSLVVRIKYGFLQFDEVVGPGSWVRFGLHQTPWLDFQESINRYRVQGQMFAEREGLIPGSGDFGAGILTPLPNGFGEVQAGVYNGEGFTQTDVNKYKSAQARLTVRPFPKRGLAHGLRISGFVNAGWYAADQPRHLGIVMGSYEHPHVVATIERVFATERPLATLPADIDRSGTSGFVEVRQGMQGLAGLLRIEAFDPDTSAPDNSRRRVIGGAAYWLYWSRVHLGFVLTDEQVHYDAGAARPNENRILLQSHVEF